VDLMANYTSQIAILHCTAAYPVRDFGELNLRCIATFRERYPEFVIGWSGHDSGIAMSVAAYTLGARIIEKHFTLNRANKGTDNAFSLEPSGLSKLVRDLQRAHGAMGDGVKKYLQSEVGPISKMRRRETPDGLRITGGRDAPTAN
jgi:sialic acid synthase